METIFETGVDEMSWDDIVSVRLELRIVLLGIFKRKINAWVANMNGQQ
jgi:hypothetical protein